MNSRPAGKITWVAGIIRQSFVRFHLGEGITESQNINWSGVSSGEHSGFKPVAQILFVYLRLFPGDPVTRVVYRNRLRVRQKFVCVRRVHELIECCNVNDRVLQRRQQLFIPEGRVHRVHTSTPGRNKTGCSTMGEKCAASYSSVSTRFCWETFTQVRIITAMLMKMNGWD